METSASRTLGWPECLMKARKPSLLWEPQSIWLLRSFCAKATALPLTGGVSEFSCTFKGQPLTISLYWEQIRNAGGPASILQQKRQHNVSVDRDSQPEVPFCFNYLPRGQRLDSEGSPSKQIAMSFENGFGIDSFWRKSQKKE